MYTTENDWYRFGNISAAQTSMNILIDSVGIGTTTAGTNNVQVGFGTTSVFIDGNGNVGELQLQTLKIISCTSTEAHMERLLVMDQD